MNDKHLIRICATEAQCEVRPWPEERRGQRDDVWIPDLLSRDAPVVSKDFTIATEEANRRALPEHISGLIVPRPAPRPDGKKVKPFTASHAAAILATFKRHFPGWHDADWSDLYVEIRDTDVSITHIHDCVDYIGQRIPFDAPEFLVLVSNAMVAARNHRVALVPRRL